ncbi:phage tail tube protein [Saccharibacter floricola]|uniref:Phage tail protein n=1 Tax=Saccharibacter floricola DSM 15669 TaxID=1123227 RepID=A0ABQ0P1M5_9PROT|nr:phage tail tube protein [Saccharibacter floricola]GBQ08941.1 hypothetical protein AA15669_1973 [Saccharibacter floricola DSM 15669]
MAQTLGIIRLFWRGKQYDVVKGVKFRIPGIKNDNVNGNFRALRSTQYQVGEVQATIIPTVDTSPTEFSPSLGEDELQLQADTGKSWAIADAYVMDQPEFSDDGKAQVKWSFNTYQEISS